MDRNGLALEPASETDSVWSFGSREFNGLSLELRVGGLAVEIEQKPLEVLVQLGQNLFEALTDEEPLESVWPGLIAVDAALATAPRASASGCGAIRQASVADARFRAERGGTLLTRATYLSEALASLRLPSTCAQPSHRGRLSGVLRHPTTAS